MGRCRGGRRLWAGRRGWRWVLPGRVNLALAPPQVRKRTYATLGQFPPTRHPPRHRTPATSGPGRTAPHPARHRLAASGSRGFEAGWAGRRGWRWVLPGRAQSTLASLQVRKRTRAPLGRFRPTRHPARHRTPATSGPWRTAPHPARHRLAASGSRGFGGRVGGARRVRPELDRGRRAPRGDAGGGSVRRVMAMRAAGASSARVGASAESTTERTEGTEEIRETGDGPPPDRPDRLDVESVGGRAPRDC